MTETITSAEPEYGTDHLEGSEAPLGGTLEHLDPTSLVLEDNVRDEADLDKAFLDSIREHGVLTPVLAARGDDLIVRTDEVKGSSVRCSAGWAGNARASCRRWRTARTSISIG